MSPEEREFERKHAKLGAPQTELTQRDLKLTTLQATLEDLVRRYLRIVAAVLAVGLGVGLFQSAQAATLTVCPTLGPECGYTSIQTAVTSAASGDVISIAAGMYNENNITVARSLTFVGAGAANTIVNGGGTNRVFNSVADIALSDLTIQNGYATGNGGGIWASGALTLTNVNVFSNTAVAGGGVYASGNTVVSGGLFQGNHANSVGGGLYANSTLTLTGTQFISNTATDSEYYDDGYGGGVAVYGAAVVTGGLFQGNQASSFGGGLLSGLGTLKLTGTQFISNTVTGSNHWGYGNGGGVSAGSATVSGGLFQGNQAIDGGGLYANRTLTLTGTQFISNTATGSDVNGRGGGVAANWNTVVSGGLFQGNQANQGGGLSAVGRSTLTLTDTQFISNTANMGGGVFVYATGGAVVSGGLFQDNQAVDGGGLYAGSTLTLTDTQFISNTANMGGGVYAAGAAVFSGGLFQGNQAVDGGGLYVGSTLTLTDTQFAGNSTSRNGGSIHVVGNSFGRMVNVLLTHNSAGGNGAALYFDSTGYLPLLYVTIASPTVVSGTAIYVNHGTVAITNTIIASYTQGIEQVGGTVTSDYNLFYNAPTSVSIGSHSITGGDPLFVDVASNNYRLRFGSPATGKGVEAGVTVDLDGTPRANPSSVGAYEGPPIPILGMTKAAAITTEVAYHGIVTYTIMVSNTGTDNDPNVVMTDVLPTRVIFAQWVTRPDGTLRDGNAITWTGTLTHGTAITFTYTVTHTDAYADVITNTAYFSGAVQSGSADATFTVRAEPTPSVTVVKTGNGTGTVSSAPSGIACGAQCKARFQSGEVVTLNAVPYVNAIFAGWSGACTGVGICEVMMVDGQNIVTATFNTLVVHMGGEPDIGSTIFFSVTLPINNYNRCKVDFGDGTQVACTWLSPTTMEVADNESAANGAVGITVGGSHVYRAVGNYRVSFMAFYSGGSSVAQLVITISIGDGKLYLPLIWTESLRERAADVPGAQALPSGVYLPFVSR